MSVNNISVFVSSADSYSDIWPAFFTLFKKEWPEFSGIIYLNTEYLSYEYEGLNIVCTKLGKQKRFGEFFLRGLEYVEGDIFLLFMIDYFLESRVNVVDLQTFYSFFKQEDIDSFTLMTQPYGYRQVKGDSRCAYMDCSLGWEIMFSFQVAFWKKASLKKLIYKWEDPWRAEYFGSRRAAAYYMKFCILTSRENMPFKYDEAGVLHGGGRWLHSAISRINLDGVPLDIALSNRSYYSETKYPLLNVLWVELKCTPQKIHSWFVIIFNHPNAVKFLFLDYVRRLKKIFGLIRCLVIKESTLHEKEG